MTARSHAALQCTASRYWHAPWPEQQKGPLLPPPAWRSRNPGLAWKAHRVIPRDRRTEQLWQEHLNRCLSKFGFVTCTADPALTMFTERAESASAHSSMTGAQLGPPPALNRVLSAIETMLAMKRTVGQEVRILGGNVERAACGFTVKLHRITVTSPNDICNSNHKHVSKTPAIKGDGNDHGACSNEVECTLYKSAAEKKALRTAFFCSDIQFADMTCARYRLEKTSRDWERIDRVRKMLALDR